MFEKKVSRRQMLKMVVIAGAGSALAACSSPAPATQQPAAAATNAPVQQAPTAQEVTITMWTWADANFPHFKAQADRWNSTMTGKPKIKYNGVLVPDSTITKGMNAMAAGSGIPDIFLIEIGQVSKFFKGSPNLAEQNLMDITPKLDLYNANWKKDYIGFDPYTFKGKVYGFEVGLAPTAYYYRKDLFDQAGITMPLKTWDDFMAAGEKMKAAGHGMTAFDTTSDAEFIMDYYQSGGKLFDANGQLSLEDDRAYKTFQMLIESTKSGIRWGTEAYWGPPHYAALNDGTVAGVLSAIWYSSFILKPNAKALSGKWRVQPMPAWTTSGTWGGPTFETRDTSTWGGTALTIPLKSANPDITFDYLAFSMLTKEGAESVYKNMQQMPMVKSVIHDDSITNIPDEYYGGQAINKVFADIADNIPSKYPGPNWAEADTELGKLNAQALSGNANYEALIKSASDKIKQIIAQG